MSLFRRDLVYASVELDRVALVRLAHDGSVRAEAMVPLLFDPARPENALDAVVATLAEPVWRDAARSVVLSDRFARYVVMQRPEGVRSAVELQLACDARFEAIFERPSSEWVIAIDALPFRQHIFVCAVARRVIDAVRVTFGSDATLTSLRPFLLSELGRFAGRLPAHCWFVATARDCLTLVGIADNECRVVRVLPVDQPSEPLIVDALAREALLTGEVAATSPVLFAGLLRDDVGTKTMHRIDSPGWGARPASWTNCYRVALTERWT